MLGVTQVPQQWAVVAFAVRHGGAAAFLVGRTGAGGATNTLGLARDGAGCNALSAGEAFLGLISSKTLNDFCLLLSGELGGLGGAAMWGSEIHLDSAPVPPPLLT